MKSVNKPWGNELWIADGVYTPYALKKIFFKAGNRTSLQVHKKKIETNYVLSGTGILEISDIFFDSEKFQLGNMSNEDLEQHLKNLRQVKLEEGVKFHVTPGHLHRVNAITDLVFIEASSCELDDVIRVQDDTKRPHGKIHSEHR